MHGNTNEATAGDPLDIDYRQLVEHIPAITYIAAWDEESSTIYTSPQVERLLGFAQNEWMSDPVLWLKQTHPDDRERALEGLGRIRAGEKPEPIEYRMLTRDGEVRWFRDHAAVLRNAAGQPLYLYGVMLDITREKRLEAALAEAQRQLEQSRRPRLDERALAVLRLVKDGRTERQIGAELGLSERTVRYCLKAIRDKLGVKNQAQAVAKAVQLGLIEQ